MAIALTRSSSNDFSPLSNRLPRTSRRGSPGKNRRANSFGLIYERDDRTVGREVEVDSEYGASLSIGKTELTITNQEFGIGLNIAGMGGKVSTEKGGTIGLGVGIVGVEYNMEGGGAVDYLFGLYRMTVERVGCTYVKRFYVQSIYTHTEVEEIDGCIPEDPKRKAIREQMYRPRNDPTLTTQLMYTCPEGTYCNGATVLAIDEHYHYPRGSGATCSAYDEDRGETVTKQLPVFYQAWKRSYFYPWIRPGAGVPIYYVAWAEKLGTAARYRTKPPEVKDSRYNLTSHWWPGGLSASLRCIYSSTSRSSIHHYDFRNYLGALLVHGGRTNGQDENGEEIRWCHAVPVDLQLRFNFLYYDGTGYFSGSGTGRYSPGNLGEPGYFKDPRKKKMKCCFTEQDRKMLKKVYGVTGCKAFPVTHPKTLKGDSSETVELQNVVEHLVWITRYLDSTLGQWPISLKIPDIDPTKQGNQESEPIEVPNISELLAEIYGLNLQEAITRSDKRVELKTAMEIELMKKVLFRLKFDVEALIDYFGFDDEFEKRKLKLAFNPKDAQNFVESSEELVRVRVFKPDKKNPTVNSVFDKLLLAASHIQKAFGIPINPLNVAGSVVDFFTGVSGTSENDKTEKLKDLLESGALSDDTPGSSDNPKLRKPNTKENSPS